MGSSRLLAERKQDADQGGPHEQPAGQERARAEQHEIERHQGESRRGVRAREAGGARQVIGTILEQPHVRPVSAVAREVAGAIHIGHLLEHANGRRTEDQGGHEKGAGTAQVPQPRAQPTRGQRRQDGDAAQAHQPLAARVNDIERPPALRADPCLGGGVEESVVGDPEVDLPGCESDPCQPEQAGR